MSNFCSHCGASVSPTAQACPSCGHVLATPAPVGTQKSKLAAVLLAFCFGMFGAHRFYLRDYWIGAAFAALTLIAILAPVPELFVIMWVTVIIDFIILLFRKPAYFLMADKK
jgi:TM2 domain-containing membrane protein YozV